MKTATWLLCSRPQFIKFITRKSHHFIFIIYLLLLLTHSTIIYTTSAFKMAIQSQKKAAKVATDHDAKQGGQSLLSKALTPEFDWSDKDEFLDVIYWMRQIMGLLLGLVWGIIPLKGLLGLALFMLVNVAITYVYYNSFQKVDEETYGGTLEILKEGLMTSVSSFLVAWIILYSALYSESSSS